MERRQPSGASIAAPALGALALVAIVALTIVGYAQTSHAATTWQVGDVFLGVASGIYQIRAPDGTLKETLNVGGRGYTTGCAFDGSGNFYGTEFSNSIVRKYLGPSPPHAASTFGGGYSTPESIAFDAAGNVYVGNLGNGIRKFASNGTFLQTITSDGVDWFDIAADQDTIFYTQERSDIKAVSITSGPLPNFATGTATQAFALRILGDGGVLLADQMNVKRYNSAGMVVQTYDQPGEDSWFSLNLDPNGSSFWAGDFGTANYYEFNINSGALEAGPFNSGSGVYTLFGICLLGELTVAVPTPTLTATSAATNTPTHTLTNTPTNTPIHTPTNTPTNTPTHTPTSTPTRTPTNTPTNTLGPSTNTPPATLQAQITPGPVTPRTVLGGVAGRPDFGSGAGASLWTALGVGVIGMLVLGAGGLALRRRS